VSGARRASITFQPFRVGADDVGHFGGIDPHFRDANFVCPPRPLDDVPWPGRTERIVPPRTDVALDGLGEGVSCGGLESIFRNG